LTKSKNDFLELSDFLKPNSISVPIAIIGGKSKPRNRTYRKRTSKTKRILTKTQKKTKKHRKQRKLKTTRKYY
jgi:hypothetical protein